MNIEAPTINTKQATDAQKTTAPSTQVAEEGKSFKEELNSIQAPQEQIEEDKAADASETNSDKVPDSEGLIKNTVANQADKNISDKLEKDTIYPNEQKIIADKSTDVISSPIIDLVIQKQAEINQNNLFKTNQNQTDKEKAESKIKHSPSISAHSENLFQPIKQLQSEIESIKGLKTSTAGRSTKSESIDNFEEKRAMHLSMEDAKFFVNLVKSEQFAVTPQAVATGGASEITNEATKEVIQVSATLMDTINEASKTNKPFRIDFDANVAVIMRIDKNGKLSAEFIPGDKAAETYLKNNIALLQSSFDEQKLPYGELSYRKQRQEQQNEDKNNQQRKKENDDE